ncbi:MAG: hypothetical protein OEL58_07100 [Desulfobacteraceae bacterium]|nr:hypothetical protein [Desulfobacteraceae bacterium]
MEKTLQQVLSHHFGYPSFRENQQAVIDTLLAGQDALGYIWWFLNRKAEALFHNSVILNKHYAGKSEKL